MKRNSSVYHKTANTAYRESQKTYAEKMAPDKALAFKTTGYNVVVSRNDIHIDRNFTHYSHGAAAYHELAPLIKRLEQMGFYPQAQVLEEYVNNIYPAKDIKMALGGIFTK